MSSEGAHSPRLHRLFTRFNIEAAAVVSILLGLVQVLLAVPLYYIDGNLPKLFLLPLTIGVLIVAAGSFTMASERFPSRQLLRSCAYSNVAGLLGALLAVCLYCVSLSYEEKMDCPPERDTYDYHYSRFRYKCPGEYLKDLCWCVTVLLLLYDIGAVVLHCLLSVSAFKALKTN
ncbi:uncharacterized protein LOC139911494 [Centroberyx gerrardi]|uniref:uncharacterized protein n=1 Tax=Centroberyx gerrardi TaxID=166262 RepID=UPI003AAD0308